MMKSNMANVYKTQQIMTASPQELTLMLYNGAIRFVAESIQAIERNDMPKAHEANMRAQDIIREFMNTLDMQYEVSQGLDKLYDYLEYRLIQANMKKDIAQLEEAKGMLTELRDTWYQAMKLARGQKVVGNNMRTVSTIVKSSQELWNDYYFLTKEMAKFLDKQDMDIFEQLMQQREALQSSIDEAEDDGFQLSATGRELLQLIKQANQHVVLKLQYMVNSNRNQNNVSRAYDGVGAGVAGRRMDQQT